MKIQVNSDNQIAMKAPLSTFVEGEVERALDASRIVLRGLRCMSVMRTPRPRAGWRTSAA